MTTSVNEVPVLIIDDFAPLPQARAMVELASEHKDDFAVSGGSYYPGVQYSVKPGFLQKLISPHLDAIERTVTRPQRHNTPVKETERVEKQPFSGSSSRYLSDKYFSPYGIESTQQTVDRSTSPPLSVLQALLSLANQPFTTLKPIQMMPHIDTVEENVLAVVWYLCDGDMWAGTSFYRHKATNTMQVNASDAKQCFKLIKQEAMALNLHTRPRYMNGSDETFERTLQVPLAFNRAIVYPANVFHAGDLPKRFYPDEMASDPTSGRLTLNGLIKWQG